MLVQSSGPPPRLVRVGIDAAVVAQHEVCIRTTEADGRVRTDRFRVQPTLTGLRSLTDRLAETPGVLAVAEPTSMTWLGLSVAVREAGCDLSLLGARHAARLRGAISGKTSRRDHATCLPWPMRCSTWFRCCRGRRSWRCAGRCPAAPRCSTGPLSPQADLLGPVGVPGCVERIPWFAADRGRGAGPVAAPGAAGGRPPVHADRGGRPAHPRSAGRAGTGRGHPLRRGSLGALSGTASWTWTPSPSTSPSI